MIQELCKIAGVKKLHTTPYHPQSNGQCERFNSTLCNMSGTLSDEERSDWKSHLGCMTHAYNCTKPVSATYSPYYLMFGRHPRLPIDIEFGLHKPNCSDNCSKSRYIQKLRRRLNYAHKKASEYSSEQAQKYKTSHDKSVKGPQLQVNDLILVKIVAHFESDLIQELCKIAGVKKLHTTPYHPQSNGQCERFNSTLCNMLGKSRYIHSWYSSIQS